MKTLRKYLKQLAFVLSFLMLLQGCTVYKSANVTLEEAVKSEIGVKIKTNDNQTLKFKKIEFKEGKFYGTKKTKEDLIKIKINKQEVKTVQIQNKKASSVLSIAVPVVATAGVIGLIVLISFASSFCMGNC